MLMACPAPALAGDAAGAYTFRSYGPEQGLRNQAVTGIEQDVEGYIFVSTEDGLFRYDGSRFERFGAANGLLSDSIVSLYREPGGRLWVLHGKGAIAWAGSTPDPQVASSILPTHRIESIAASLSGHLLAATKEGIYEGKPGSMALVPGLPKVSTGAVWIAPDGRETLATAEGKLFRRMNGAAWASRPLPPGFGNELIHTIIKDKAGRIWIRGRRVLLRIDAFDGAETDLSDQLPGASLLRGHLVLDKAGAVWTPTNSGLVRFDGSGAWKMTEQQGLPNQSVSAILFDREGNLWVSSEGVHRLQGRLAWSAHTRRQNLPSNTVWNVHRSADGVLWAGTSRGLARSTETGWQVFPGTEERTFYTFMEDQAGRLWVGGTNAKEQKNALLMRAPGTADFTPVPLEHIAGPSTVNTMQQGADGALYLGMQAHGVHRLVLDGAAYKGAAVALPKGEPKEQINQIIRDAKGRLWVAGSNGLAYFDGSSWQRFGVADGLREAHVEAIVLDPAGGLLVSYWNIHGLTRFPLGDAGIGKATQIDSPAAMVGDNIYSLGYDVRGALWLGTAQGIKRFKDGRLEQFGRGEGLPSDDAASNAFWADANGDVWFGMASGLAHYHASADQSAPPLPVAKVLRLVDGSGRELAGEKPQVAWQNRALTFRFAVLGFTNETKIRSQVRLAGFEDEWRDTDIREARYTGLPPGSYRFEVRASMGGTEYGPAAMRDVVILAPWWRTGWAIALAVLGCAVLLFLFLRWRLGYLHRRNSELESLVRARTNALEKANEALQEASMVDPLTGLKNRRFLGLSMPDELARVSRQHRGDDPTRAGLNKTLLFFMVDLDHFKSINDTYGHAAGDIVLQQTSAALRGACRDADFVVRWGGEEFLIVARNSDRNFADVMAGNLIKAIRDLRFDLGNGVVLERTCSLGFSAYPVIESAPEAHSWEDAVKMADQCLYAAKRSGRDAWVGVIVPANLPDPGPRMASELGALVEAGEVPALTSLPNATPLVWQ